MQKKSQNTEFLKTIKIYEKEIRELISCAVPLACTTARIISGILLMQSLMIGNRRQNGNIVSFFKG